MATPNKKPCKFGNKCHRAGCWFAHPTATNSAATPFTFNVDANVFVPQHLAEEAEESEPVEDKTLTNEEYAELNPEFAAALVNGLLEEIVDDDLHEMNNHFEVMHEDSSE